MLRKMIKKTVDHELRALSCRPCHVVYTDYRPTPLQHYVFPAGGDALLLVVDEKVPLRAL